MRRAPWNFSTHGTDEHVLWPYFAFQTCRHVWDDFESISNTGARSKLTFEPSTFQSLVLENYNFDTSVPQWTRVPLWQRTVATWSNFEFAGLGRTLWVQYFSTLFKGACERYTFSHVTLPCQVLQCTLAQVRCLRISTGKNKCEFGLVVSALATFAVYLFGCLFVCLIVCVGAYWRNLTSLCVVWKLQGTRFIATNKTVKNICKKTVLFMVKIFTPVWKRS